jgi:hypothetical protein
MPERLNRREAFLPLERRAADRAELVDDTARTVKVVWTTGATVRRYRYVGWDGRVAYDETLVVSEEAVNLTELRNGAPVVDSHRLWSADASVATIERVWIEGQEGHAVVRFCEPGVDEFADRLFAKIKGGQISNLSVGYSVEKVREVRPKEDGDVLQVIVERWTPRELSFVAIGADPRAQVRGATDERQYPVVIETEELKETRTMPEGDNAQNQAAGATPAAVATPGSAVNEQAIREVAIAEERERSAAITDLCGRLGLDKSFQDDLIRKGTPLSDARVAILEKRAEMDDRGTGHTQVSFPRGGLEANTTRIEGSAEALLHRMSPASFELPDRAREFRGLTLIDMAREALEAKGVRTRSMSAPQVYQEAMAQPGQVSLRMGGMHTGSDFPLILANVAGKRLRAAFQTAPRTFVNWTRAVTAKDFKPMFPTQIGNFPALQAVGEGAEFTSGAIAEGREQYQLGTFGRIVGVTRQAIINDDLRAFDRMLMTAGMKANDLESAIVYAILTANAALADGTALFHASRNNLGTQAAINDTSLAEAWQLMSQQRELTPAGVTGDPLANNIPRFIIVPTGGKTVEARRVTASITPAKASDINAFANALEIVSEPRLNATSALTWYLAGDPNVVDTIEVARLEGQEEPFMDQRVGFNVDGMEFKIRHDFAAKALDFRGLFRNIGQ